MELVGEAVCKALEGQGVKKARAAPSGALRAAAAANYIGVGRSRFYGLLKEDPELLGLSFRAGRARMWSVASLDNWMEARQVEAVR